MFKDIPIVLEIKDLTWIGGLIAILITTLIQGLSKHTKPWNMLFKYIGSLINSDIHKEVNNLKEQERVDHQNNLDRIESIESNQQEFFDDYYKNEALNSRRRVIRGADDLRHNRSSHSNEFYADLFEDIRDYNNYCREHKEFENNKVNLSIDFIEKAYKECLENNDFL